MSPKRQFTILAILICVVAGMAQGQQQTYVLGPGDVVEVKVWSAGSQRHCAGGWRREFEFVGHGWRHAQRSETVGDQDLPAKGNAPQQVLKVDFEAVKKSQNPDIFLQPYDVIEVTDTGFWEGGNVLKVLAGIFLRSTPLPIP